MHGIGVVGILFCLRHLLSLDFGRRVTPTQHAIFVQPNGTKYKEIAVDVVAFHEP